MLNRKIIPLPHIIPGFIAGFVFLLRGCLQNTTITGNRRTGCSADGRLLVVVVARKPNHHVFAEWGLSQNHYSTSYWLKQYDTETGKLLKKKNWSRPPTTNRSVACYGAYEGYIWLHTDQLRAYG